MQKAATGKAEPIIGIIGTVGYFIYGAFTTRGLEGDIPSSKLMFMVSAISSSASTILSSAASTSSSSSSDDLASLEAQLAEKQAALSQTQDEQEKATIEKSIETLEAKIAKIEATESGKGQASASSKPAAAAPGEFSGESERIGTKNFDETSEFGSRTAYV